MDLPPELKAPSLPKLSLDELADHERHHGSAFADAMMLLHKSSYDFSSSVGLFDFATKPPNTDLKGQWCFIAARNGAAALKAYAAALANAREMLTRVPSWQEKVDPQELDEAHRQFSRHFPSVERMRTHDVAHPAPGNGEAQPHPRTTDCLSGHTYMSSADGSQVSYELTLEKARCLRDITRSAIDSLDPIVAKQEDEL